MKLANKTALVTGSSRGIGEAIALAMAREGADVALTGRSLPALEAIREKISALKRRCIVIEADLATREGVEKIVDQALREFGRVDILVNNAGLGSSIDPKPVTEFDDRIWDLTLFVNLTAPYLLTKKLLPGMVNRRFGRVINVASGASRVGLLHGSAYAASKHGLLGFTRSVALEHLRDGITANCLSPGVVNTQTNDLRLAYDSRRLGKSIEDLEKGSTPLGRRMNPEEVAPLAVFLASDEAAFVNGQCYHIDAGGIMA